MHDFVCVAHCSGYWLLMVIAMIEDRKQRKQLVIVNTPKAHSASLAWWHAVVYGLMGVLTIAELFV
jgi:hypothetical protein